MAGGAKDPTLIRLKVTLSLHSVELNQRVHLSCTVPNAEVVEVEAGVVVAGFGGIITCAKCQFPGCGRWFLRSAGGSHTGTTGIYFE
jgi:hypothetical protein